MKTIAIILAAFIGLTAHAAGLVGTNYAALSTGASDPHNPFTHQTLISAGAAGNYAVLPYLDVGAIATDSRLPSQQFDLSATTAQLEATLHAPLPYVTPYVTLGAGWAVDKLNGANYHGVTNFAAGGIEASPLATLTVGASLTFADLHKDVLGGLIPNTRTYEGYAVFWLTPKYGVRGAYAVAQPTNAASYTLSAVYRF